MGKRPVPAISHLLSEAAPARIALAVFLLVLALAAGCAKRDVQYPLDTFRQPPRDAVAARNALSQFYTSWRGVPYSAGGMSRAAVDCSGLAFIAYRDIFGMHLPRTVEEQARYGRNVTRESLRPGDLVFFRTGLFQDHVGIFYHESSFIHASSSKGVMISRLDEPYWQNSFSKAKRLYDFERTASR